MRNKIILLMLLSIITAFSYQESYEVLAHSTEIDVMYDNCDPLEGSDDTNEKWYVIHGDDINQVGHLGIGNGETLEIKYYYNTSPSLGNYVWENANITSEIVEEIKDNFSVSMKKWDNIYIYSMNSDNIVTKRKLVSVSEGNENDYNLIIYPEHDNEVLDGVARAYFVGNGVIAGGTHKHYSIRGIDINPSNFYASDETGRNLFYTRTGAHELGHILGLGDIDSSENTNSINYHHEELLMGYSKSNSANRQTNITYKDIAGAMITMGFHTDADHKWMYSSTEYGGYKFICSICNGVKYSPTLPDTGVLFEFCKNPYTGVSSHTLSSGNMMAVASYEHKDYIKCKYCRYVAPFEDRVQQNYVYTNKNSSTHTVTNDVVGLSYSFEESHCIMYAFSKTIGKHRKHCVNCDYSVEEGHAVTYEDYTDGNDTVKCIICNQLLDKNSGWFMVNNINPTQTTVNGSYILPNGIIILVEEDIEAYKEGTLVFNDANSEIM